VNGLPKLRLSLGLALLAACTAHRPGPSGSTAGPPSPVLVTPPAASARAPNEVVLIATGDIIAHETLKAAAASQDARDDAGVSMNHGGWDEVLRPVSPSLQEGDVVFGNLESPVAPDAGRNPPQPFVFNGPAELPAALRQAGFNLLSTANNHTYDQGREGLLETLSRLQSAGLTSIGAGSDRASAGALRIFEVQGMKIGCLAYTARFNNDLNLPDSSAPEVVRADPARMEREVRKARASADFVLVALHWGTEYAPAPDTAQVALAHRLVEAGASLILGSHSHVVQPLEFYDSSDGRRTLIAYSLGNFISNQSRNYDPGRDPPSEGDPRDGVLLRVVLERQPAKGTSRVRLSRVSYVPLWTENNALEVAKDPALAPRIQVVLQEVELDRAHAELAHLEADAAAPPEAIRRARERITLLEARRNRVLARLGSAEG
jgi:poly-gamma-glutamate synthesis protein (capsule biosynthesis protein)